MIAAGCAPNQIVPSFPSRPTGGKHGSYVHVSMWDYNTPFYTQFVPPERLHQQYARMIKLEATAYLLANVGRLRPNLLGAAAVAEIGWNAGPWADPNTRTFYENTRFKFWLNQKLPLPRQVAYLQSKTGSALNGWDRAHWRMEQGKWTGWYANDCHGVWEKGRQACDTLDAVALQLLKGT